MKLFVTGTRGIPNIQGGVETHCEELYPHLVQMGYNVTIARRSCYVNEAQPLSTFKGIRLIDIFAPKKKSLEAFLHTFLAIWRAKKEKAEIIHIHAVGPALFVPFARLLGLKVVFTHHGADYERAKWGRVARFVLKLGERMGTKYANELIVISKVIQQSLAEKFNRKNTHLIFNGVNLPVIATKSDYITNLGLQPRKYIFTLGRFVEEKGFDLLIQAFSELDSKEFQLIIAGDADHESEYSKKLKELAKAKNVVLTGFIKGEKLQQLFTHAGLFVLPSYHEGLPIALLEAMSYNLPVLVSDIPANMQIELPKGCFFKSGNFEFLKIGLESKLSVPFEPVTYNLASYNWAYIAKQTASVYEKLK
jgi:glycosyltransferase involved in cell wall biosynthesis